MEEINSGINHLIRFSQAHFVWDGSILVYHGAAPSPAWIGTSPGSRGRKGGTLKSSTFQVMALRSRTSETVIPASLSLLLAKEVLQKC